MAAKTPPPSNDPALESHLIALAGTLATALVTFGVFNNTEAASITTLAVAVLGVVFTYTRGS